MRNWDTADQAPVNVWPGKSTDPDPKPVNGTPAHAMASESFMDAYVKPMGSIVALVGVLLIMIVAAIAVTHHIMSPAAAPAASVHHVAPKTAPKAVPPTPTPAHRGTIHHHAGGQIQTTQKLYCHTA